MRREFVCPRCGLVLEANAVEGVVWMGEHVARCAVPARAVFTAIEAAAYESQWRTSHTHPRTADERCPENSPLAFTWRETLSLDDAEFLHGLGIDPT